MPAKFDRCVRAVKKKGGGNPYAICNAALKRKRAMKKNPLAPWDRRLAWAGALASIAIAGVAVASFFASRKAGASSVYPKSADTLIPGHRYRQTFKVAPGTPIPSVSQVQKTFDDISPGILRVVSVGASEGVGWTEFDYLGSVVVPLTQVFEPGGATLDLGPSPG